MIITCTLCNLPTSVCALQESWLCWELFFPSSPLRWLLFFSHILTIIGLKEEEKVIPVPYFTYRPSSFFLLWVSGHLSTNAPPRCSYLPTSTTQNITHGFLKIFVPGPCCLLSTTAFEIPVFYAHVRDCLDVQHLDFFSFNDLHLQSTSLLSSTSWALYSAITTTLSQSHDQLMHFLSEHHLLYFQHIF